MIIQLESPKTISPKKGRKQAKREPVISLPEEKLEDQKPKFVPFFAKEEVQPSNSFFGINESEESISTSNPSLSSLGFEEPPLSEIIIESLNPPLVMPRKDPLRESLIQVEDG